MIRFVSILLRQILIYFSISCASNKASESLIQFNITITSSATSGSVKYRTQVSKGVPPILHTLYDKQDRRECVALQNIFSNFKETRLSIRRYNRGVCVQHSDSINNSGSNTIKERYFNIRTVEGIKCFAKIDKANVDAPIKTFSFLPVCKGWKTFEQLTGPF